MNIKNWSYTSGKRLNEYRYIRYRITTDEEIEDKVYCNNDNTFYELLDIWNKSHRWNKFYSKETRIRIYSIEIRQIDNIWKSVFSSSEKEDIKRWILRESPECRNIRIKTIGIDNEESYILNISLLLGKL